MGFRPYVTWIDEYPCVSYDVAKRLKAKGYDIQTHLAYDPDEDGINWVKPWRDGLLAAPTYGELVRFYYEMKAKELGPITLVNAQSDYVASNGDILRRERTPEDAVAEVILAVLGDTLCSHPL